MTARRRGFRLLPLCLLVLGCGAQQTGDTTDALFASEASARAKELAPDLHHRAESVWNDARAATDDGDSEAADDLFTEARLWLAAAATESERIELERRRLSAQADEERWAKQLAHDQSAAAEVARDISRHEARTVALREAERLTLISDSTSSQEVVAALVSRARLNLAVAEALGADPADVQALDREADALGRNHHAAARKAEGLLLRTEALVGTTRASWPEPLPGADRELVDTALALGFAADRTPVGVTVRSERFFASSGKISTATTQRFLGLLSAFPHGPVACQVAVPARGNRQWAPRVANLVERLARAEDASRVSTGMVMTDALSPGTVQCSFAAYGDR